MLSASDTVETVAGRPRRRRSSPIRRVLANDGATSEWSEVDFSDVES